MAPREVCMTFIMGTTTSDDSGIQRVLFFSLMSVASTIYDTRDDPPKPRTRGPLNEHFGRHESELEPLCSLKLIID